MKESGFHTLIFCGCGLTANVVVKQCGTEL